MKKKKEGFIKRELSGWTSIEILWLVIATVLMLAIALYSGESTKGICAVVAGMIYLILIGKGKMTAFLFGLASTSLYAYIAFETQNYASVLMGIFFYIPMNLIGLGMWRKHMSTKTKEVERKRLTIVKIILLTIVTVGFIVGFGLLFKFLGATKPYIDSMGLIFAIFIPILCVKRYTEQWVLLIILHCVTGYGLLMTVINEGRERVAFITCGLYLVNAIIMLVKWYKDGNDTKAKTKIKSSSVTA